MLAACLMIIHKSTASLWMLCVGDTSVGKAKHGQSGRAHRVGQGRERAGQGTVRALHIQALSKLSFGWDAPTDVPKSIWLEYLLTLQTVNIKPSRGSMLRD